MNKNQRACVRNAKASIRELKKKLNSYIENPYLYKKKRVAIIGGVLLIAHSPIDLSLELASEIIILIDELLEEIPTDTRFYLEHCKNLIKSVGEIGIAQEASFTVC